MALNDHNAETVRSWSGRYDQRRSIDWGFFIVYYKLLLSFFILGFFFIWLEFYALPNFLHTQIN
jgi:hypothetical protein